MAQISNTFSTYDAIGEREDLSDVIYNISPTDTPFMSAIAKTKAGTRARSRLASHLAAKQIVRGLEVESGGCKVAARVRRMPKGKELRLGSTRAVGPLDLR